MASEPDIVEIYVNKETKEVLQYIPAADMMIDGEDLPKGAIYVTQININDVIETNVNAIMVCPHDCSYDDCNHRGEHLSTHNCEEDCHVYGHKGGCYLAEFTPLPDGDEEEIG